MAGRARSRWVPSRKTSMTAPQPPPSRRPSQQRARSSSKWRAKIRGATTGSIIHSRLPLTKPTVIQTRTGLWTQRTTARTWWGLPPMTARVAPILTVMAGQTPTADGAFKTEQMPLQVNPHNGLTPITTATAIISRATKATTVSSAVATPLRTDLGAWIQMEIRILTLTPEVSTATRRGLPTPPVRPTPLLTTPRSGTIPTRTALAIIGMTLPSTILGCFGTSGNLSTMRPNPMPAPSFEDSRQRTAMAALTQTWTPIPTVMKIGPSTTVLMLSHSNLHSGRTPIETVGETTKLLVLNESMISRSIQRNGGIPMRTDGVITKPTALPKSTISPSYPHSSEILTAMVMATT